MDHPNIIKLYETYEDRDGLKGEETRRGSSCEAGTST